jgi:hypothetical protein
MRRNKGRSITGSSTFEISRAGRIIPSAVMHRAIADAKVRQDGLIGEQIKLYRETEKYRSELRKRTNKEPALIHSVAGLRGVVDKIAKRQIVAPSAARPRPGILAGSYSLRLTPGYDYGEVVTTGFGPNDPRNSGFVNRQTGELGLKILADKALNVGNPHVRMQLGAFFIPMFGPARLQASIAPALSFAWWTVSTGPEAMTWGSISFLFLGYRFDGTFETVSSLDYQQIWYKVTNDLEFDLGSNSTPMSTTGEIDTDHFYLIRVNVNGLASCSGLPPQSSVAGGILNMTLPYIDLDLKLVPVVQSSGA